MSLLLTSLAWLAMAALAVMALGIVLLPVYDWVMWRDSKALREARNAGLIP